MFLYGFVGSAPCGGLLLEKLQACTQPGLDGLRRRPNARGRAAVC